MSSRVRVRVESEKKMSQLHSEVEAQVSAPHKWTLGAVLCTMLGTIAAAVFLFTPTVRDALSFNVCSKPIVTLSMAGMVLLRARNANRTLVSYDWYVIAGLVAGALGDWFLAMDIFLPGLLFFFLGHIFYVAAFTFCAPHQGWALWRLVPFAFWLGTMTVTLQPGMGGE
jgi:uncharacterized membrane protein YhhN